MKRLFWIFILCGVTSSLHAACFDHSLWDSLLKANVDENGFVNYDGVRAKKGGDLQAYLASLQKADLKACSEKEKLAFWINAYNAQVFGKILARPSLKKVSEDFKLFDEKITVAGLTLSLNDIENRVIRSDKAKGGPILNVSLPTLDPRIHFALVCAALDCPKLINQAYEAPKMEDQLQKNAIHFANSNRHLRLESGKLVISTLTKWYGEDFQRLGGVSTYLSSLTDPNIRNDEMEVDARLKSDFPTKAVFKYDWTLNDVKNKK